MTDATDRGSGSVRVVAGLDLLNKFYHICEVKGERSVMSNSSLPQPLCTMCEPDSAVGQIVAMLPWEVARSLHRPRAHVNEWEV